MSRARHFEDFEVGAETVTDSRTVTEADVVAFAGVSGDYNPLHVDVEFARTTPFGERIAHGLLGLAIASGLVSRTGAIEGTTLAFSPPSGASPRRSSSATRSRFTRASRTSARRRSPTAAS